MPTATEQEESVVAAAEAVGAARVERFSHGTTIATNALLERKGAVTAFVATEGFEHLLHLRRQTRAHLYRLCDELPAPLVPLERCHGVRERIGPDGVLVPLDLGSLPDLDGAEAVAVCLLFSFRDPSHEPAVADELRRRLPGAHVVASHEFAPEFREYERASTTAADAYLGPVCARYFRSLAARAAVRQVCPSRSSCAPPAAWPRSTRRPRHAALVLVSGPAGGVVGAARAAAEAGIENAISFDMGGTSTDVCLIAGGRAERTFERSVGGLPIRLPMVDIHTVGAGGGSIVWRDAGGAVRVGPESAGANPGPACYGRGGQRPTVTDANLLLGRLPARLAGGVELDRDAAERAMAGFDPADVVEVVNAEMLRALPRRLGRARARSSRLRARRLRRRRPAARLRARRGARDRRLCSSPRRPGVLSALGLVASEERRDSVRSYVCPLDDAGELPRGGRGRSPLPRPVVRADSRARRRTRGARSTARTRSATATRTASGRSSSSPCGRRRSGPAPTSRSRRGSRSSVRARKLGGPVRAGPARTGGADLLDRPRVGGGSGRDRRTRTK